MSKITGVVNEVIEGTTKNNKSFWAIKVDGKRYGGIWSKPSCDKGDEVEFAVNYNGNFANVNGTITVLGSGNTPSPTNNTSSPSPAQKKPFKKYNCKCDQFPINPLNGQMSIILQSSLNRATDLVIAIYNNMPTADQKKMNADDLWTMVSDLADKFSDKASGYDQIDGVTKAITEQLEDKKEKFEDYKKLLSGELDNE